ncbi:hypothetical protein ACTFIW_005226 [Dictyostelium discoideum]
MRSVRTNMKSEQTTKSKKVKKQLTPISRPITPEPHVTYKNDEEREKVQIAKSKFENNWKNDFDNALEEVRESIPLFLDLIRIEPNLYKTFYQKCAFCVSRTPAKDYILCSQCFRKSEGTRRRVIRGEKTYALNMSRWSKLKEKLDARKLKTEEFIKDFRVGDDLIFDYF